MKKLKYNFWFSAMLITISMFVMSACNNDDAVPVVPVAYVSLYNGSPDAPDLSIAVDDRTINFYPFEYADYTGYLRFYTGDRNLRFGPFGASNAVIDTTVTFDQNNAYSVFVVNEYDDAEIIVLDDDDAPAPSSGKSNIRVINLSPDAPAVDFAIEDESTALVSDISFKENSEFTEINSDDYEFQIRESSNDEVLLQLPDINLLPGYYYTLIVRGYQSPPDGNNNVLSAQIVVN